MIGASVRFVPNWAGQQNVMRHAAAAASDGAEACGKMVLDLAQMFVPVDTGELRTSGHLEMSETPKGATAQVIFDAPHAAYVEFGTGVRGAASAGAGVETLGMHITYSPSWPGMPAQPYLRPALDQARPAMQQVFGNAARAGWMRLG